MTDETQALCFLAGANSIFVTKTADDTNPGKTGTKPCSRSWVLSRWKSRA